MTSKQPKENGNSLPARTQLEEFTILGILGSGGFGITYLAHDSSLQCKVVIKENLPVQFAYREPGSMTVRPHSTTGPDAENFSWSLDNFLNEARILAGLSHPCIVPVRRRFECFGTGYFVMPFIEGRDLEREIEIRTKSRCPYDEIELTGLLEHVLDALHYLHSRQVQHRDIKPSNILISKEGVPILIDFGSARQTVAYRTQTVLESAGFTPFEQSQTHGNVGPWSDLYALGCTLCKAITGETPPRAVDRIGKDRHVPLATRPELVGRYSHGFLAAVDRAMDPMVENRWQQAADWWTAISAPYANDHNQVLSTRTAMAPKPPVAQPIFLRLAAVVTVVLLLAGLGILATSLLTPSPKADKKRPVVPITSSLRIRSDPTGATVKDANGRELGITPCLVDGLAPGSEWSGTLELNGYMTAPISGSVTAGEQTDLPEITLEPSPQQVILTSEPSGAIISRDGVNIGKTPWTVNGIAPGTQVTYQFSLKDHKALDAGGTVEIGKPLEVHATLTALPRITITSNPAGASIYMLLPQGAANVAGLSKSPCDVALPDGVEELRLTLENYRDKTVKVSDAIDGKLHVVLDLANPELASKEKPFVNHLGMEFVPAATPNVLFCRWETRYKDFNRFTADEQYNAVRVDANGDGAPTTILEDGKGGVDFKAAGEWRDPWADKGVPRSTDDHPVVSINYEDAKAFCDWLNRKEQWLKVLPDGWHYRLPYDKEWTDACGPGEFPWGVAKPGPAVGNYMGMEAFIGVLANQQRNPFFEMLQWNDGFPRTAPVASFIPNAFGLYDMGGNAREWCLDWFTVGLNQGWNANLNESLRRIIRSHEELTKVDRGGATFRVTRGGSWYDGADARDAGFRAMVKICRFYAKPTDRLSYQGFRCVLTRIK